MSPVPDAFSEIVAVSVVLYGPPEFTTGGVKTTAESGMLYCVPAAPNAAPTSVVKVSVAL
jgi:hypothetical protein